MAFEEVVLPQTILLGSSGGPVWDVDVMEYGQGSRYVNIKVNQSRYRFSLRHVVERTDIFSNIIQFFEAMGGPATGFLLDNWLDNSTAMGGTPTATDMTLGTGDGTTTVFNLSRQYTQGGASNSRRIYKPKTGTVLIAGSGSPEIAYTITYDTQTSPVAEALVSTTAGTVTFATAPADGAPLTWGGEYYYPVALEGNAMDGIVGPDKWYELSSMSLVELLNPS